MFQSHQNKVRQIIQFAWQILASLKILQLDNINAQLSTKTNIRDPFKQLTINYSKIGLQESFRLLQKYKKQSTIQISFIGILKLDSDQFL
ncbi:hypothetical protein pb186bvf_001163 [Paramecium bursaria]